jgi:hypothetical protein
VFTDCLLRKSACPAAASNWVGHARSALQRGCYSKFKNIPKTFLRLFFSRAGSFLTARRAMASEAGVVDGSYTSKAAASRRTPRGLVSIVVLGKK